MPKYLRFFLLGIVTFIILCFTSWWLIAILVLWTLILFRLVESTAKLKKQINHQGQPAHGMPVQKFKP
jgi:hypothetical protein